MKGRLVCAAVLGAVLLLGAVGARLTHAQHFDFPDPIGYVNDFAGVLGNDSTIDQKLRDFDKAESTQILVITVNELPGDVTLEEFVPFLTEDYPKWQAGQDEYDNGVIFTVVVDTREMRIDTGYGVEGALPDALARSILDNEVRPKFREGDYDGGVEAGVDAIIQAVQGEYTPPVSGGNGGGDGGSGDNEAFAGAALMCLMILSFIMLPYLGAFLGRTRSWWLGGVLGFIGGAVLAVIMILLGVFGAARYMNLCICPMIMGPVGLLFDYILSKNYKIRKKKGLSTGWGSSWGGFSSGGFSGGGSSGGFSSGGGSFGGGGASSGW